MAEENVSGVGPIPDLSLVPSEALRDALLSRFDHGAIVLYKNPRTQADRTTFTVWKGHGSLVVGLMDYMAFEINQNIRQDSRPGWEGM